MSPNATGAFRSQVEATEGRTTDPLNHGPVDPALTARVADAIRRQLADLEASLASAMFRLHSASRDGELSAEVEDLRAELRSQKAALSALAVETDVPAPGPVNAASLVLKGNTAWNVLLNKTA
ncbi:MAG: hypothetical protein L6Q71_07535 [Planctomycetes bacterium]|nr:hypothetical protein [Planctomycetota bacterium]NUQ36090.1 hypothetical protein [Planctomycetaceae bacterium]